MKKISKRRNRHLVREVKPPIPASPSFLQKLNLQFRQAIKDEEPVHIYGFLIILGLAIVNRIYFLFQPIRYDEAFCFLGFASQPLADGLSNYSNPNNHLFHTLLEHFSFSLFGSQEWALRLPALLAGILLVPAVYVLTRIFYHKQAALISAAFIAGSSTLIEYSTNARGYTLLCLIVLLLLIIASFLRHTDSIMAWLSFAVLSALGFYTIPIMLYPFGILLIWLFLSGIFSDDPSRKVLFRNLIMYSFVAATLTLLLYTPVILTSGFKSITGNRFVAPLPWAKFIESFPHSLTSIWKIWNRDIPLAIQILGIVGFIISLAFHSRLSNFKIPLILPMVLWIPLVLVFQKVVPFERVWLFLLPLYFMLVASGLYYLLSYISKNTWIFSVLALVIAIILSYEVIHSRSVYYSNDTGTLRDAPEITLFLKNYLQPGDQVIAITPSDTPLQYYFLRYSVPLEYWLDMDHKTLVAKRLFVVVNKSSGQTLEGNIKEFGAKTKLANLNVTLLKDYQSVTLYELR